MNKVEARQHFKRLRNLLSDSERVEKSKAIAAHFFQHIDISHCAVVHIFLPIVHLKEIDTHYIFETFQRQFPQITVVVPRVNSETQTLDCIVLSNNSTLELGEFNIPEPIDKSLSVEAHQIDIVVLPLLAVDTMGHRVGYGKGFYDKFLKTCRPDAKKMGLSYYDPISKISDIESHDIPLDGCVTPNGLVTFPL